ncbi:hypothetical protein BGZ70_008339 [Mortierella alpina]|uniref:DUF4396 domain-containing protein n=1 Tax=Mortierella alpina TaxID=64518 RepID=A0A9P6M1U0_MORAP|nr:hypothetical protein BGZ70_008339 [Mortierella alpina]
MRWTAPASHQTVLRSESFTTRTTEATSNELASSKTVKKASCCSSSSSSVPHVAIASANDQEEPKSCHSHTSHSKSTTASALPVTSGLFWSDPTTWKTASTNTFRCLIGCTAGDMSMLFYLQSFHPTLSPGIAMAMAMASGITTSIALETVLLRFSKSSRMPWRAAFKTATGMSLISMLTMEAVENAVDIHLMGWGNVNMQDPLFWKAIGISALAGWSAPLPFNYWNLKRHGKSCH